jgi:chromosome segregation ATPase
VNIVKSYTNLTDRITELQKRLSETDKLLTDSKTSYDELWNALKNKNTSAESIDSLNKIILNKSELVLKFSKEKESLIDQINNLIQQKDQYNEDLKYISFNVSFIEKVIIDMETLKDQWYYDYKTLVDTFNDTVRNLTINLISFLLKTLNVFIYAVL